jgi:hypothetical protein
MVREYLKEQNMSMKQLYAIKKTPHEWGHYLP